MLPLKEQPVSLHQSEEFMLANETLSITRPSGALPPCALTLHIVLAARPELVKTEFFSPQLKRVLAASREHYNFGNSELGTFRWSKAVQALTILTVRTACWHASGEEGARPVLDGYRSSLAASLDYALSKQPTWLLDVFGAESGGTAFARKIILRQNPELKRPGPVVVSFSGLRLPASDIKVCLDGMHLRDAEQLRKLAEALCFTYDIPGRKQKACPTVTAAAQALDPA